MSSKGVGFNMIHGCKELIKIRDVILKLMQSCETLAEKMENQVSKLMSKTAMDQVDTDENSIITQPRLLNEK